VKVLVGLNGNRLFGIRRRHHSVPLTLKETTGRLQKIWLVVDQQQVEWFGECCEYHTIA
jgi:hypothetical protein